MRRLSRRIEIEPLDSMDGYLVTDYTMTGARRYELRGWGELLAFLIHRREEYRVGEQISIDVTISTGETLSWKGEP